MGRRSKAERLSRGTAWRSYVGQPGAFALAGFGVGLLGVLCWWLIAGNSLQQPQALPRRPPVAASTRRAPEASPAPHAPARPAKSAPSRHVTAREVEAKRQEAYQYLLVDDKASARDLLLEALSLGTDFDNPAAEYTFYNGLGWSLNAFDPEQAIVYYRRATAIVPPPAPQAHYNLATLLTNKGDLAGAIAVFKHLYEYTKPDAAQLHNLAKLEVDSGRPRDALLTLRSAQDSSLHPLAWQKNHYYLAQTHMQLHEWREASASFARVVHWGLATFASAHGCSEWRVAEGWSDGPGVKVTQLSAPAGAEADFTDPLSRRVHRDAERKYKLVHLQDVRLDGDKLSRLYHAHPQCTLYLGEMTASAMPHAGWGTDGAGAQDGGSPLHVTTPTVVLYDTIGKHSGFFHLQVDVISRILYFLREVYDPTDTRWLQVHFLVPAPAMLFLKELRGSPRAAALGIHVPGPERFLPQQSSYRFDSMYLVDWTPPIPHDEVGTWIGDQSWRTFNHPLYELHLPPGALLRLQNQLLRRTGDQEDLAQEGNDEDSLDLGPMAKRARPSRSDDSPPRIVWLSRQDSFERHVVGEDRIIEALRETFGSSAVVVFGRNSPNDPTGAQRYDVARSREVFGAATVLIGPHGAAFANLMFTDNAAVVLLPICDAMGCPAQQDVYFTYLAGALGSELAIPELGPMGESVYRNYTLEDGPAQVDEIVRVVRAIIAARATRLKRG